MNYKWNGDLVQDFGLQNILARMTSRAERSRECSISALPFTKGRSFPHCPRSLFSGDLSNAQALEGDESLRVESIDTATDPPISSWSLRTSLPRRFQVQPHR